uniref:Uncharacterized protein n=1 Tax=Arion vulgaris TaxID=1028688 RepID=A0A0B7BRF4_9EUPU
MLCQVVSESKKPCRQYDVEYFKYVLFTNKTLPMCLNCHKVFSHEAMAPSRLEEHLSKIHPGRKDENVSYVY